MAVEKLLEALGIDSELVKAATAENANIEEIATKARDAVSAKLLDDEKFYGKIDRAKLPKDWFSEQFNEGANKIGSMSKQGIDKQFGITEEDKATFTAEELKDITKYVAKAATIYKTKTAGNSDVAKLQDENVGLKSRLKELETAQATLQEKFESDLKEKLTAKEMETLALITAAELQQNVPVSVQLIFDKVFSNIKNKYAVVLDNGRATIRKKDNTAFKVEKGKGYMELKDALEEEFKAFGAWKDIDGGGGDNGRVVVQVQPNKLVDNEALKKAMEAEKAFLK
jgi:hypothetical protein